MAVAPLATPRPATSFVASRRRRQTSIGRPCPGAEIIGANHRFLARLERLDPAIATDLGRHTEVIIELQVVGFDPADGKFAWLSSLKLPVPIDPARPGDVDGRRVTVEEREAVEADRVPF